MDCQKSPKIFYLSFFFFLLPTSYSTHLLSHLPESISLELPSFKFIISILPILAYTDKCFSHLLTQNVHTSHLFKYSVVFSTVFFFYWCCYMLLTFQSDWKWLSMKTASSMLHIPQCLHLMLNSEIYHFEHCIMRKSYLFHLSFFNDISLLF